MEQYLREHKATIKVINSKKQEETERVNDSGVINVLLWVCYRITELINLFYFNFQICMHLSLLDHVCALPEI